MKTLLQYVLLVSLALPCRYLSAQTTNRYDLQLKAASASLASSDDLQKLVILDRIYQLRELVTDESTVLTVLQAVSSSPAESLPTRAEADALADNIESGPLAQISRKPRWYESELRQQVLTEAGRRAEHDDADGLQLLAELEFLAGIADAAEHMHKAAQLSPTPLRWEKSAEFSNDTFRRFADFQSALALDPGDSSVLLQLASYYIGRNQLEKARDLLSRAAASHPGDFVIRERLATVYLNLGIRSQALRELTSLSRQWPGPLWLKARLALDFEQLGMQDEAARLASSVIASNGLQAEMLELLARFHKARHMIPELEADSHALAKLRPRSVGNMQVGSAEHGETSIADGHTDSQFLVDAAALAQHAFSHPAFGADLALADVRVQELNANGTARVHVQQIFSVGSEAAVEAHRMTTIRFSPSEEKLRIEHARLWKPNGQRLEAQDLGERDPAESSASIHYDTRFRQFRLSGIEVGDVVELEYSLSPLENSSLYGHYFGEFVFFAGATGAQLKRYVLIAPAAQTIYTHVEKVPEAAILADADRTIRIWEAHRVAPVTRESRAPGLSELAPYVHVSTFSDWGQLGAWYADLIRPQFLLDERLRSELAKLLEGKRSDREKIAAIQDFVLRSTHYLAQEFGVYSYKPYPVAQTYARRFGDCKDKASLMIALLRAAGIDARIALVRTRSLGDVATQPASVALFDHAIVYIPKYDLWLDGTAEYAVRELPLQDQGALALTVALDGTAELRHTPVSRASDNYTRHLIQARLSADGTLKFSGATVARGEDAPGLRQEFSSSEQQVDSVRRDLARIFPTVHIDSVQLHDPKWTADESEADVRVEFRGGVDAAPQKRTAMLDTSWLPRAYVAALASSGSRSQDLLLFAPWITEEEVRIAIPVGARVTELPRDKTVTTPFGTFRLRYRKSAQEILIQSHTEFDVDRIGASDYPQFREFCLQLERSFREQIKVELPR